MAGFFVIFAGMKRLGWIGIFVLLMVACTRQGDTLVKTRPGTSPQTTASHELSAIDSLMWQRPDSALTRLLPCFDTCCRDGVHTVSTAYNCHYAHLLLAELLYKNYCEQTNRPELQQAVQYFDSLLLADTRSADTRGVSLRRDASHASALMPPKTIAFLDARAHYINGVGYYENDSIVEACAEYLKALEIMEEHFEEKELVGHKARFMVYVYNRLGEMFEEQMLANPGIICFKQALHFCKIEPTSIYGIPVLYYSIGIQYDITNQKDSAFFYYDKASTHMPDNDNFHYRDIIASKAILAYNEGRCSDSIIKELKQLVLLSENDEERITRFLTLGNIMFEDKRYDSSRFYLETVFGQQEDIQSKIVAAENLCKICQMTGDSIKALQYSSFLADCTMKEIEKRNDASKINEMFKNYSNQKQEKQAEEEREKAVRRTKKIIIPISVAVALAIAVLAKHRGRKLLKKQQTEAATLLEEKNKQLAKERKARQREKEKLQQGLLQREEQLNALEKTLGQQREAAETRREAFMKEAICCKINDSIRNQRITARNSHEKYVPFTEADAMALKSAVLKYFENFETVLLGKYPKLSGDDLQLCQFYLMGLDERQIAVLQSKSYSAIKKRANSLKDLLRLDENLKDYLMKFSSFQETSWGKSSESEKLMG